MPWGIDHDEYIYLPSTESAPAIHGLRSKNAASCPLLGHARYVRDATASCPETGHHAAADATHPCVAGQDATSHDYLTSKSSAMIPFNSYSSSHFEVGKEALTLGAAVSP